MEKRENGDECLKAECEERMFVLRNLCYTGGKK